LFTWIARVVVRRPLLTIAAWVIAAVVIVMLAPSLRTSSEQSSFLPDHYESIQAMNLAQQAFGRAQAGGATGVLVVKRADDDALTAADQARVGQVARDLASRRIDRVASVVTGPQALAPNRQVQLIFLATIVLIIALQLLIFRSPIAAALPIVAVLLVFLVSQGLVGVAGELFDLQADQSLTTLLTVVLFGIGTDYILFLLFRYRERLRAGDQPKQAVITATARIGEVIASAAAAVIIAFSALTLSSLGFLKTMGPSMAIAVAVMLVAALTLIPALIALLGPRVFWPSRGWRAEPKGSLPRRAGTAVGRQPVTVALASGAVVVALALGALGFVGNYDFSASLPDDTESALAFKDLQRGFPAGALEPTTVYLRGDGGQRLDQAAVRGFAQQLQTVAGVAPSSRHGSAPTARSRRSTCCCATAPPPTPPSRASTGWCGPPPTGPRQRAPRRWSAAPRRWWSTPATRSPATTGWSSRSPGCSSPSCSRSCCAAWWPPGT